jgi:DNA-binding NarL/FixJ family response regulator
LIKRIKDRNSHDRILVWSMRSEALYAERALRAGAMDYVNKDQSTDQIVEAIRWVLTGKIYLSESMTERILRRTVGDGQTELTRSPLDSLADRELDAEKEAILMGWLAFDGHLNSWKARREP